LSGLLLTDLDFLKNLPINRFALTNIFLISSITTDTVIRS
jgi:hypothetical protein